MLTLTRLFEFCSSHTLSRPEWDQKRNLETFGKCSNPNGHGHNYTLEVTITGTPDPSTAMLLEASKLGALVEELVVNDLDHRDLNRDVPWLKDKLPTSETLVSEIWDRIEPALRQKAQNVRLHEVRLQETRRIWVSRRAS